LLISTLPGQNGALRISVWRALKALGVGNLRDGAYALPDRPELVKAFEELERDVVGSGGSAYVFRIEGRAPDADAKLSALFDRSEEYAALITSAEALIQKIGDQPEAAVRRAIRQLRRDVAALEAIDYFGNRRRDRLQSILQELDAVVVRTFSPDEPRAIHASIEPREKAAFQHRRWTTRHRLWIDRVASAWLIRRFIDEAPTFVWLEDPHRAPDDAVGFDFDGATFTHVDGLTTYEVLVAAFGLGDDRALGRIGAVVHCLDLGGAAVPEAAGFEAILSGMRESCVDDDDLLDRMSAVLDALYGSFVSPATR
jgi:cell fate (sporulation/competence/biofilm development) regulator YlbF (YheA/YmcA/DUF963 family)